MKGIVTPEFNVIDEVSKFLPNARWGVWVKEPRENGSIGKVPKRVIKNSLSPCPPDDASMWSDYSIAAEWFKQGFGDGIGVLVGCGDQSKYDAGFIAVDFDDILDEQGNLLESVPGEIKLCLTEMQSKGIYLEISPSGEGLRGLYLGSPPTNLQAGTKFNVSGFTGELYSCKSARYVSVTGNRWSLDGAPSTSPLSLPSLDVKVFESIADWLGLIKDSGDAKGGEGVPRNLPPISDEDIIRKVKQSRQGKGNRLFSGDTSDYGGDHSAADAALCGIIAKHTDEAVQVGRVFGLSDLATREKWQKRKDYRDRTIANALNEARKYAAEKQSSEKAVERSLEVADTSGIIRQKMNENGGKLPRGFQGAVIVLQFDSRCSALFAFDTFGQSVVKLRALCKALDVDSKDANPKSGENWTDADDLTLIVWLYKTWKVDCTIKQVALAVEYVARSRPVNKVVEKLSALIWDGVPRLDTWLETYAAVSPVLNSDMAVVRGYASKFLIGCVARAMQPGCKQDHSLVFVGEDHGRGKSQIIRVLAEAICPSVYAENLPSIHDDTRISHAVRGKWIVEIAEASSLTGDKATAEMTKAWLTRTSDHYRAPYEKRFVDIPRTANFIITTNEREMIKDHSGTRRFWVVEVGDFLDVEGFRLVAEQIWAEAYARWKQGDKWWFTDREMEERARATQRKYQVTSGFDEMIVESIINPMVNGKVDPQSFSESTMDVFKMATGLDKAEFMKSTKAFSNALKRLGFTSKLSGGVVKVFIDIGSPLDKQIRQRRENLGV